MKPPIQKPAFSVIIPARDEEKFIGKCIESVKAASEGVPGEIEIVVVINRCSDHTEEIVRQHGAIIVQQESGTIGKSRNAGAEASSGENIVFIDADSLIPRGLMADIAKASTQEKAMAAEWIFNWIGGRWESI